MKIDKIFHHVVNKGKVLRYEQGVNTLRGEIVVIQDADLEYDPNEYPKLIKPILDGNADVVYGSRFRSGEAARVLYYGTVLEINF